MQFGTKGPYCQVLDALALHIEIWPVTDGSIPPEFNVHDISAGNTSAEML